MRLLFLLVLLLSPAVAWAQFDMGFDSRNTVGFVTDPAYGVMNRGELYPNTYTNANGKSINAGWDVDDGAHVDRVNTNDPRIAGMVYLPSNPKRTFKIDLSSGSAPGAGSYLIDIAAGDPGNAGQANFTLKDNTTTLIDGTNGGAGFALAANHFRDATLTDITATTTWTGTQVSATFASTTVNFELGPDVNFPTLAHLRLTLQSGGAAVPQRTLTGVGT